MRLAKDWSGAKVVEHKGVGQKALMPNPAPLPLLSVSKLGVARGDALMIDDLSFEVTAGEALHVRGQNGAGKSTLLLALAGLIPVATGEMSEASQSLGFLGHDNGLLPDLTVAQNLDAYVGSGMAPAEEIADAQILYLLKTEHLAQHIEYF